MVRFTGDGKQVISRGAGKTVRIWDATTGEALKKLTGHEVAVYQFAFTPEGRLLTSSADRTVKEWDLSSGAERGTWPDHDGEVYAVAASAKGAHRTSGGKFRAVLLWTGEPAGSRE
jgi:WD40 repeat protein